MYSDPITFQRQLVEVGDEIFGLYVPKLQNDLVTIVDRAKRDVLQVVNALLEQKQFQRYIKPGELSKDELRRLGAILSKTPKIDSLIRERVLLLRMELREGIRTAMRRVYRLSHKRLAKVLRGIMPSGVQLSSNIHVSEIRALDGVLIEGFTIRKRLALILQSTVERLKAGLIYALMREASFTQVKIQAEELVRRQFASIGNAVIVLFEVIAAEADTQADISINKLRFV